MVNRRIIIPRGAVDPNRTNVIEIPFQLQNEPHLIAKPSVDGTGNVGVLSNPWDEDLSNVAVFDAIDIPTYRKTNTSSLGNPEGINTAYSFTERPSSYQRYGGSAAYQLPPREIYTPPPQPPMKPSKNYYEEVEAEPNVTPPPVKPSTPRTNYYQVVDPATGQTYWAPVKNLQNHSPAYDYAQYNNYYRQAAGAASQPVVNQRPMENAENMQMQ